MADKKLIHELIGSITDQGFIVRKRYSTHYGVFTQDGVHVTDLAASPSDCALWKFVGSATPPELRHQEPSCLNVFTRTGNPRSTEAEEAPMFTSTLSTETVSICELVFGDILLLGTDEVNAKVTDVSLVDGDVVLTYDEGVGTESVV